MDGRDGGTAAICASGGGGPQRDPSDVGRGTRQPGGTFVNYYNSLGRLAVFRRKFESVTRWAGADPTTFTTELEILASQGFGDMGTCALEPDGPGQVYCGPV